MGVPIRIKVPLNTRKSHKSCKRHPMLSNPEEDDASEAAQNKRAKFEIPKIPRQSDIQPMDIDEKVSQIYRFIMRKIY